MNTTTKVSEMTEEQLRVFIEEIVNQRLADWLRGKTDMLDPETLVTWKQVRQQHPNVWVVAEAIDAYDDEAHGKRIIPHMRLIQAFADDSRPVLKYCGELHRANPQREYFFYHTSRETLDIGLMDEFRRRLDR